MHIILMVLRLYELLIIARALLSWIRMDPCNPFTQWIERLTEPVLGPVRRLLPQNGIGIDFSPIVVIIGIEVIQRLLVGG